MILEVVVQLRQRQALVDVLAHAEGRLDVQRQPGDHAQRAEVHRRRREDVRGRVSAESVTTSPSAVTSSSPETAVARFPLLMPEPCVAVAQAPATEMCGSEARLCSAKPCRGAPGTTGRS